VVGVILVGLLLPAVLAADPPDLTGTFGLAQVAVAAAKIPVLGDVKSATLTWSLLTITRDDAGLHQRQEVCAFEILGRNLFAKTRVPPGYTKMLPIRVTEPGLRWDGAAWRWDVDMGLLPVGYDPKLGPFPTTATDPGVADTDKDGHPGATVLIDVAIFGTVEVYASQATRVSMHGTVQDADHVAGALSVDAVDQLVIDASNRIFVQNPRVHAVQEGSTFRMARVPAGTTCDGVRGAMGG